MVKLLSSLITSFVVGWNRVLLSEGKNALTNWPMGQGITMYYSYVKFSRYLRFKISPLQTSGEEIISSCLGCQMRTDKYLLRSDSVWSLIKENWRDGETIQKNIRTFFRAIFVFMILFFFGYLPENFIEGFLFFLITLCIEC